MSRQVYIIREPESRQLQADRKTKAGRQELKDITTLQGLIQGGVDRVAIATHHEWPCNYSDMQIKALYIHY